MKLSPWLGLALLLATIGPTAAAQNRAFAAAPIFNGVTAGTNVGANVSGYDPVATCGAMGSNVWYSYVATCNGTVTVSTCAPGTANFDTVIAVYDGSCGPHALVLLNCNDDTCALDRSTVAFNAAVGMTYFIEVGGFNGAQGTFSLSISCVGAMPSHNECAGALAIPLSYRIVGTNVGATTSPGLGCNSTNDVWYTFTAAATGNTTVTTCQVGSITNFDTVVTVFKGACGALIFEACNDDNCANYESEVVFGATSGTQYWVSVGGFNNNTGRFGLKVSQETHFDLRMWDQGPGTIGFRVGDTGGNYYIFLTTNGFGYPNGWFFGISPTWNDVIFQSTAGFPFQGPLTTCGTQGPFGPLPAGFTLYSVAFLVPSIGAAPTAVSVPRVFTVL